MIKKISTQRLMIKILKNQNRIINQMKKIKSSISTTEQRLNDQETKNNHILESINFSDKTINDLSDEIQKINFTIFNYT